MNKWQKAGVVAFAAIFGACAWIIVSIDSSSNDVDSPNVDTINSNSAINIPKHLEPQFITDWSKADSAIAKVISGGPAKDGIPAIDDPKFITIAQATQPDSVQAIVVSDKDIIKVYPYNILIWHEIVNDSINSKPISVTFCPLCGSAIVYESTLPDGSNTTFGVSGSLLESNMIMYDRATETLWQQSTGKSLAGKLYPSTLTLVPMQLLTIGEVREKFPDAQILSEETGHSRDYAANPYSGYETTETFYFEPSKKDERFPSKEIFAAFRYDEGSFAFPAKSIENNEKYSATAANQEFTIEKTDGELLINDEWGSEQPFYYEMWFSWAAQHQEDGTVLNLIQK